jgi:inward rectifier potassium channel
MAPEDRDLGFGAVVARESRMRLLNRDGSFNVVREGLGFFQERSPYHRLLSMSWPAFVGLLASLYVVVNLVFALLYLACGPGALVTPSTGAPEGRFLQAFFFSVETFATIGYGNVYPRGIAANALMTLEALVGLLGVALATGIIFARFARPAARIRFSRMALIAPYRDGLAFEFRVANERSSQIIDLAATVLFTRFEDAAAPEEKSTRQFHPLALERERVVFFPLSWTVVHPITESSPLHGLTEEDLRRTGAEFLVLLSGFDETYATTVHQRTSYKASEVRWNARFSTVYSRPRPDGTLAIDMAKLDDIDTEPAAPASP